MALPVTAFMKDQRKLTDMFGHATSFGLAYGDCDSYSHHVCQEMKTQFSPHYRKKIVFLEATLVYGDIINHMNGAPDKPICIGESYRPEKNAPYTGLYYATLFDCLDYMMTYKKIIFLSLSIDDYAATKHKKKKSQMIAHGTTAIFIPVDKHYKMFYINSHGQDMRLTNFYDFPLTKTRDKHITFNESIDTLVMKFLVSKLNRRENSIQIEFNGDAKDTYDGVNLQSGDGHGICFIFPFVIWYYFGNFYNKTREIGAVTIPSVKNMLLSGNINRFVHSAFIDFSEKFKNIFIENIREFRNKKQRIETLENIIIKDGTHFVKKLGNTMISYLTQAYFTEKIKNN